MPKTKYAMTIEIHTKNYTERIDSITYENLNIEDFDAQLHQHIKRMKNVRKQIIDNQPHGCS